MGQAASTVAHLTVSRLLDRSVQIWCDKVAIQAGGTTLTYAQLQGLSCQFARHLQSIGVAQGQRLALIVPNSAQFVVLFYAIARIGAVLVPLNPAYADDELIRILRDANVKAILCTPSHRDRIEAMRDGLPELASIISIGDMHQLGDLCRAHSTEVFDGNINALATHAIMFTSGTTGRAKGAILSHHARVWNSLSSQIGYEITSATRANVPAPLFHSGGMLLGLISVLSAGGTLLIPRDGSCEATVDSFVNQGANLLLTVPTMIVRLLDHTMFGNVARNLPFSIIHGAAPISRAIVERLLDGFPKCRPFHGYGSTEACQLTVLGPDEYRRFHGATGRALPGVEVRVVDEHGRDVGPGTIGEIVTAGPHVFDGYLDDPEHTAEALRDGLHWTGDLATISESGIITIVGRRKDMIISGGFNVYPREVEDVLQSHEAVQEAAVFGVPDIEWGEAVAVAVIVRPGKIISADEIIRYCRNHLASYKKPKHVCFITEMPRNALGKIEKSKLVGSLKLKTVV